MSDEVISVLTSPVLLVAGNIGQHPTGALGLGFDRGFSSITTMIHMVFVLICSCSGASPVLCHVHVLDLLILTIVHGIKDLNQSQEIIQ